MKKYLLITLLLILSSHLSYAVDAVEAKKCLDQNTQLAQGMLNAAAQNIGFEASDVTPSSVKYESMERYEFSGFIYRATYKIIVKTDKDCFPKDVVLVDMATR
ncbi:MAG: hypothetical protein HOO06_15480 [Bdellovibrionaceae bacterium]|mgnify:CR=1 FL=1|jgi:hypothetical protein|nr:hypothetical protein [Pseudobdellovibrionaceae bacterium]